MTRSPPGSNGGMTSNGGSASLGSEPSYDSTPSYDSKPSYDSDNRKVIVGIDGSDNADHALVWALDKAAVLGELHPVTTFQLPTMVDIITRPGIDEDLSIYRETAEAQLIKSLGNAAEALSDHALGDHAPVDRSALLDRAQVIEAQPGPGLCAAAESADLLVVGTRGRGALTAGLLGSVSSYCAKHATVPVAVIPDEFPADRPLRSIVVGVDGSDNADAALRWAIDHAAVDGRVHAVGAVAMRGYYGGEFDPPPDVLGKQVRATVESAVERVTGPDYDGPSIEVHISTRDARMVLRDMADEADLLVLGARGVSGIPFLVLGSVASALVHHARVPTVVVPGPERAA